ncbi:MAG: glycerol kinase [bacterium]|nr:glycerol kinase [bacterium]
MQNCEVDKCTNTVPKPGHTLCYDHWKAERDGELFACEKCGKLMDKDLPLCSKCYHAEKAPQNSIKNISSSTVSSTALGKEYGLSATKVNQILAELGWIMKYTKGWTSTPAGRKEGAQDREMKDSGVPYVVWPGAIINNKILSRSIREFKGEVVEEKDPVTSQDDSVSHGFREKFPCTYRATDGHMVRSKAEVLIDNFLYANGIVHAFERKLPIEENVYCDFYLPEKKVYIEYWGLENDEKYQARKEEKKLIYIKYNYNLIELLDKHVRNLDDDFPKMLLAYGINSEG